jgi:hypothetical protein
VDNGINSPRTHSDIRIESGSTSGTTMDYDLVHLTSASDALLIWNSNSYTSLSAFRTASKQEAHGIDAAPGWKSPGTGDFHLTAGSPAIDSANANAPAQTAVDKEGFARVDDPVTPDTGVGVRTFDDRGALEYRAPALGSVAVSPANATLTAGGSQTFSAEGYDLAGNDIGNVTSSTTFTIGPNGSCTGTSCSATQAGLHTVTATVAGVSGSTTLTVVPAALDHLVLTPGSATIASRGTPTAASASAHTTPVRSLPAAQWTTAAPSPRATSRSAPTIESGRSRR